MSSDRRKQGEAEGKPFAASSAINNPASTLSSVQTQCPLCDQIIL